MRYLVDHTRYLVAAEVAVAPPAAAGAAEAAEVAGAAEVLGAAEVAGAAEAAAAAAAAVTAAAAAASCTREPWWLGVTGSCLFGSENIHMIELRTEKRLKNSEKTQKYAKKTRKIHKKNEITAKFVDMVSWHLPAYTCRKTRQNPYCSDVLSVTINPPATAMLVQH